MLPKCPYCGQYEYYVRVKGYEGLPDHRSTWPSCTCADHADQMEEVRVQYLQDLVGGKPCV